MAAYHTGELEVQARAGVLTEGARMSKSIRSTIPLPAQAFLRNQHMVVVSTVDTEGCVWASLLTGKPGFIEALNEQSLRIAAAPSPGDPLFENLVVGAAIGLLAIEFVTRRRMRVNGRVIGTQGGIVLQTEEVYANCHKYIQARGLLVEDYANGLAAQLLPTQTTGKDELSGEQQAWIEQADTFFIASHHRDGGADASHRGGHPGFVRVESATRLLFPDYSGNRMFQTLGNISADPHAGLLFIDFENGNTLQLSGTAQIIWEGEQMTTFPGAERLIAFEVEKVIEMQRQSPLCWDFLHYSPTLPVHGETM
jgi:predicted pyridoxine 5'-phosphate oxidase superfamily flavin-nucleotide-binding protein